jgi:hypothetical protein
MEFLSSVLVDTNPTQKEIVYKAFGVFLCVEILLDAFHFWNNHLYPVKVSNPCITGGNKIRCIYYTAFVYRLAIATAGSYILLFLWPLHTIQADIKCWFVIVVCVLVFSLLSVAASCKIKNRRSLWMRNWPAAFIQVSVHVFLLFIVILFIRVEWNLGLDIIFISWISVYSGTYVLKYPSLDYAPIHTHNLS